MNARNVPAVAMIQKMFWKRSVTFVPRISNAVISRIMNRPPRKIQTLSVWNRLPQVIRSLLWKKIPNVTSVGPSANTGKYRAQNVAPIIAENAAPKLDTVASGGGRKRAAHTQAPPRRGQREALSPITITRGIFVPHEITGRRGQPGAGKTH